MKLPPTLAQVYARGKLLPEKIRAAAETRRANRDVFPIGVLEGEGVGPEVIAATLNVASALESSCGVRFQFRHGGAIGTQAEKVQGHPLTDEVSRFCAAVFDQGGAILAGPGGGRFVYDLRKRFDLFCKIVPLKTPHVLENATVLKSSHVRGTDIVLVRENVGGIYQGRWTTSHGRDGDERSAGHSFSYSAREVTRIIDVAAAIAAQRRGRLTVVVKDGGVPTIADLWRECAAPAAAAAGVALNFLNIDLAAYELVQHPGQFDVIVCGNLFGDVLADLGAVLLGSRGISFSGNYSENGSAVYQTNHGAGYDLAGRDVANPAGQIYSFAMLLRETFGLEREAALIEHAVELVWCDGWRTFDVRENENTVIGTKEMGARIAESVARCAEQLWR